ncbi:MAG: TOBE domain-containing protein, partial [Rhizobium rhizophilum]
DLGGTIETFLDVAGTEVVAVSTPRERPVVTVGQDVGIVIDPETAVVLSA